MLETVLQATRAHRQELVPEVRVSDCLVATNEEVREKELDLARAS